MLRTAGAVRFAAIEAVRELPTSRFALDHVAVVSVVEGSCIVRTEDGEFFLHAGASFALGSHRWRQLVPHESMRIWTIHIDEDFLRTLMQWLLPHGSRLRLGLDPSDWSGSLLTVDVGTPTLLQVEPLWRRMSLLRDDGSSPEVVGIRTVELLANWIEKLLPSFLNPEYLQTHTVAPTWKPFGGRLTDPAGVGHFGRAMRVLRERVEESWSIELLAREVALSGTHLHRIFVLHAGAPPMRLLRELRVTAFARLIEETDMPVSHAAGRVGWTDPRVAMKWFHRRYGMTPTQYRSRQHRLAQADDLASDGPDTP